MKGIYPPAKASINKQVMQPNFKSPSCETCLVEPAGKSGLFLQLFAKKTAEFWMLQTAPQVPLTTYMAIT